jgi:hypothetical protein
MIRWLLPQGTDPAVAPVFLARALRGFVRIQEDRK